MTTSPPHQLELDPGAFAQLQSRLSDWTFFGRHHMHKSWQFPTAQQALRWHALAQAINEGHGRVCCFYLGHVGSGRIETDIFNRLQGHLTREDIAVAEMLNALVHG